MQSRYRWNSDEYGINLWELYREVNPACTNKHIFILFMTREACACRHCRKRILHIHYVCAYICMRMCTSTATTQRFDLPPVSIVANAATRQQEAILVPAQSLLRPRERFSNRLRHELVVSYRVREIKSEIKLPTSSISDYFGDMILRRDAARLVNIDRFDYTFLALN